MTLPSTGPLSLSQIKGEFGGNTPPKLGDYYAGGSFVAPGTSGVNGAVPSSGALAFSKFLGTTAFSPVTHSYTSSSGTETVPTGAGKVVITVWGHAGAGGAGDGGSNCGGGGGGEGATSQKTLTVSGGETFSYNVNNPGTTSTVTGPGTSMSCTPGIQGGNADGLGDPGTGSAGGGASGGDTNTPGNPGSDGDSSGDGGNGGGVNGGNGGSGGTPGSPGVSPSGAGDPSGGGGGAGSSSGSGAAGGARITFYYTAS